jgi:hypothetical protein
MMLEELVGIWNVIMFIISDWGVVSMVLLPRLKAVGLGARLIHESRVAGTGKFAPR